MSETTIALVYFSATHVTKSYAEVIQQELLRQGVQTRMINVTSYASRQKALTWSAFTGVIFGFPVFADFAPRVINDWLPTLQGANTPCAMFFTYGARTTGYAHFHTKLLLEQANFRVLFSAEFLGRHTFNLAGWRVLPHRPDETDFGVARQFAHLACERFPQNEPDTLHIQKPFGYPLAIEHLLKISQKTSAERGWCHPVRFTDTCQMCRRCATECPNQAFDADAGLSNPVRCILCQHCVYICPDKALKIDDRMKGAYLSFLQDWHLTEDLMQAKQSKLITAAWQASS